jgi:hypothetical protein
MSDEQFPARLLARGRDEGAATERTRILAILAAVAELHYLAPARHALKEIERRIYDVEAMPS